MTVQNRPEYSIRFYGEEKMINYTTYEYDENCVFGKQRLKDNLEKQLGDFGEQLVMTLLGRIARYSVSLVNHEGADLIASDKKGNGYAISVKACQIGPKENETKVFKDSDQKKLCVFAKDFDLIPAVAMIMIPKDFAYIDVYLMTLAGFNKLADKEGSTIEINAIKKVQNGLQINNYSLGTGKKPEYSDKNGYLSYLQSNELIEHVRLDVQNRENFRRGIVADREANLKYLKNLAGAKDNNLKRQLGDSGEYLLIMLIGRLKKYKVARVDHVGADIIASDQNGTGDKYAISVKTTVKKSYTFYELYSSYKINPKHELKKLDEFAQRYKMKSVLAIIFIKADFSKIDIYISSLENWMQLGHSLKYGTAIQYEVIPSCALKQIEDTKNWKSNLSCLKVNIGTAKNKKIIDNIDSIEHMEIQCLSLFKSDFKWI